MKKFKKIFGLIVVLFLLKSSLALAEVSSQANNIVLPEIASGKIKSKTDYIVVVDTKTQNTLIYKKENNQWNLAKTLVCSTGVKGKSTPKGIFTITARGPWFYSKKYKQGGVYWIRFKGRYLFHSLPMNTKRQIVDYTLGKPSSHGCVRLSVEDAKWMYENIPNKTTVYIK